jgi:hypothetical protein
MSNSRRKHKFFGMACTSSGSMKQFRKYLHHKERVELRKRLKLGLDVDYQLVPWDEWASPRDGIKYWADATEEYMRK